MLEASKRHNKTSRIHISPAKRYESFLRKRYITNTSFRTSGKIHRRARVIKDISVESGQLEGDFNIHNELQFAGMITGNATVIKGGKLILRGMICKNLILERGSEADLYGMVCQNVYNKGGKLRVYGTIAGTLVDEGGTIAVERNAVIVRGITKK